MNEATISLGELCQRARFWIGFEEFLWEVEMLSWILGLSLAISLIGGTAVKRPRDCNPAKESDCKIVKIADSGLISKSDRSI